MGWTFMHRPKGYTDRAWIEREVGAEFAKRIVAVASTPGVMHVVIQVPANEEPSLVPDENGNVRLCLVYLTKWVRGDEYNWGYKDMEEFSGPVETKCPLKLLDMLSPFKPEVIEATEAKRDARPNNDEFFYDRALSARDWRAACRKRAEGRKALTVGVTYKLPRVVRWSDGGETDTLKLIERKGQRIVFLRPDSRRVRITRDLLATLEAVA
jgi:hypothetical protein